MINDERTQKLRAVLREERYRSGLTVDQLVLLTGFPRTSVLRRLKNMADVYIVSWIYPRAAPGRAAALYTAVFVPPDARPPEKKANRRKT